MSQKEFNGDLVLARLNDLKQSQEKIVSEMTSNFKEINNTLADFKTTISDVKEIKSWKKEVTDVWSPKNMELAEKEIYDQKNRWSKAIGILIAVEFVVGVAISVASKHL
jgi:phage/plasmid-associated DNA primase